QHGDDRPRDPGRHGSQIDREDADHASAPPWAVVIRAALLPGSLTLVVSGPFALFDPAHGGLPPVTRHVCGAAPGPCPPVAIRCLLGREVARPLSQQVSGPAGGV